MNKKRWIAVGIAAIILTISILIPAFKTEEEKAFMESAGLNPFSSLLGDDGRIEEIIEEGDPKNRVAFISLEGGIASGSSYGPGYTHEDFIVQLEDLAEDDTVKAVLLSMNTTGGAVFESEEIRQRILDLQEKGVPVYASFRQMSASGGYWIGSAADKIYAYPETITGSIGVIFASVDLTGLYDKLGIEMKEFTSGPLKSVDKNSDREAKEEEAEVMQGLTDETYGRFVDVIVEGRGMDETKVRELGDGRIYNARQALENGLIDEIGSTEDALAALIEDTGLSNPQVFQFKYSEIPSLSPFGISADLESISKLNNNAGPRLYSIINGGE